MPISGLMLTLSSEPRMREAAVDALRQDERIELGLREGPRLAAVIETADRDEDQQLWRWINDLTGIDFVDVVFVEIDDNSAAVRSFSDDLSGAREKVRS